MGQQKAGEIIDREKQLVPVGADLPRSAPSPGAEAGIVDEDMEPVRFLPHRVGEAAHFGKCGEVGGEELGPAANVLNLSNDFRAPMAITAVNQNARTSLAELLGYKPAYTIRRASDESSLSIKDCQA
jgi:hypothetical protein